MAERRTRPRLPGRRQVLGAAVAGAGLAAIGATRARQERAAPADTRALRPPGAMADDRFLAACVRCGLCVQGCPWNVLHLADERGPVAAGTPYFRARSAACVMCQDLPCQRVCPTGALGPATMRIEEARIGLAALSAPEACYSFIGAAACNSCFKACPLRGRAITMRRGPTRLGGQFTPTVDADVCTGCGLCEQACIAERPAITVVAIRDGRLHRSA